MPQDPLLRCKCGGAVGCDAPGVGEVAYHDPFARAAQDDSLCNVLALHHLELDEGPLRRRGRGLSGMVVQLEQRTRAR